uniref:Peptidase M12B domain-containing protein n=1 Tax=Pygocentrus nattereri TaxID=42514 RepID=A0A3B4D3H8_PYGNA
SQIFITFSCMLSLSYRELISSNYIETHYTPNGTRVTADHQCYYHGSVGDDQQSIASISTCEGLRYHRFKHLCQDYMIEPLTGSETGEHGVFKAEFFRSVSFSCGVTNETLDSALPRFNIRVQHRSVVREFQKLGSDVTKVRKRMFQIINFVNMVYFPLHTFIGLVGLEVWSDGDKINVTSSAAKTLSAFTQWRTNELNTVKENDNAQLIT